MQLNHFFIKLFFSHLLVDSWIRPKPMYSPFTRYFRAKSDYYYNLYTKKMNLKEITILYFKKQIIGNLSFFFTKGNSIT